MKKLISMLFMAILTVVVMTGCDDEESIMQKFTVTFDSQGGSEIAAQAVYAGEKIVKPADPTKEKEFFVDWYKEAACTNVWDFENETVSQDITLYAKWASTTYTVTFESNGGTSVEVQQVVEGKFATKPQPIPAKEGYLFDGWYTEQTLSNEFDFYTHITKDITLYAKWLDITSIDHNDLLQFYYKARSSSENSFTYTEESREALKEKIEEVQPIVDNPSANQEEIVKAYQTLYNATQALVELPYRPTVSLMITPTPIAENVVPVYLSSNEFSLTIAGRDIEGHPSTHVSDITLEFDGNEIAKWGEYHYYGLNGLGIILNGNVKAGTTMEVKVICNDAPSLSTTLTLKAISKEELKKQYIDAINTLPETVTFDNCLKTQEAYYTSIRELYQYINESDMQEDSEVKDAINRMEQIIQQLLYFTYYNYQFEGNTFTGIIPYSITASQYEYKANGNFPCGTYTQKWRYDVYNRIYSQSKMELKSDNSYQTYWRNSNSKENQETVEWNPGNSGKYKVTGDQKGGGTLILQAAQ